MDNVIFLDRDGTLIKEKHYISNPDDVELEASVIEALGTLQDHGFSFFIITNQSGLARNLFATKDYERVQERVLSELKKHNITIQDTYMCPHHPAGEVETLRQHCNCRKPHPGMLINACKDYKIHPDTAFMIGDKAQDVEAGHRAHMKTILVETGYGHIVDPNALTYKPHYVAPTLLDAANWILRSRSETRS